jgi:hypothetical protein
MHRKVMSQIQSEGNVNMTKVAAPKFDSLSLCSMRKHGNSTNTRVMHID